MAAFELLQKLLVTITTSDVTRVREYQRRCELALMDILLRGAAAPVRNSIPHIFIPKTWKRALFDQLTVLQRTHCWI